MVVALLLDHMFFWASCRCIDAPFVSPDCKAFAAASKWMFPLLLDCAKAIELRFIVDTTTVAAAIIIEVMTSEHNFVLVFIN